MQVRKVRRVKYTLQVTETVALPDATRPQRGIHEAKRLILNKYGIHAQLLDLRLLE